MQSWTCTRRLRLERTRQCWGSNTLSSRSRWPPDRHHNIIRWHVSRMACWRIASAVPLFNILADHCWEVSRFSFFVCGFNQAAKRGLLVPGRGRGGPVRGRGSLRARGRGSRGRGRGVPRHAVVDHRPRALEISGFTEADGVDLLPHFAVSSHKNAQKKTLFLHVLFMYVILYLLFFYVCGINSFQIWKSHVMQTVFCLDAIISLIINALCTVSTFVWRISELRIVWIENHELRI